MKDICIRESYQKDGQEKVSWNRVGVLIETKEGKQYVKMYAMPGVLMSVFERKAKEAPKPALEVDLGQDYEPGVDL